MLTTRAHPPTLVCLCRYDPQKFAWESSKGMTTLRSRVGVAVVDRKLYAFGGYDGSSRLYTVECFDPEVSLMYLHVFSLPTLSDTCIYMYVFHFHVKKYVSFVLAESTFPLLLSLSHCESGTSISSM